MPEPVIVRMKQVSPLRYRGGWGPWHLDAKARTLYTEAGGYRYDIDLETCTNSAEVLDWICQIAEKHWGPEEGRPAIVAGLVHALIDVLHPQGNLCSWGQSKRLTRAKIRHLVDEVARYRGCN